MANQNAAIRYTLERIRATVRQQSLSQGLAIKAKRIGDPEQQAFWAKLALYEQDLRRILRQLLGKQVALENERSQLWRIPREQRYSARQSVDDRETVNLDLVELAEITLRELLEFSGDASTMKPGDWEKLGEKVTELCRKDQQSVRPCRRAAGAKRDRHSPRRPCRSSGSNISRHWSACSWPSS